MFVSTILGTRTQHDPRDPGLPLLHKHRHVWRRDPAPHADVRARLRSRNYDWLHQEEWGQLYYARLGQILAASQMVSA